MGRLKKMTELVESMPKGEKKEAMESALAVIRGIDKAQADYDALDIEQRESLPTSIRKFFGESLNFDDFDADIPFD